jgi:hypothetical protein
MDRELKLGLELFGIAFIAMPIITFIAVTIYVLIWGS